MRKYAAFVVTNLIRGYLIEKRTGTFPPANLEKLRRNLKKFNVMVRYYRELSNTDSNEEMSRHLHLLRDQMKLILKQNKNIIDSNKMMLSARSYEIKEEEINNYLNATVLQVDKFSLSRKTSIAR